MNVLPEVLRHRARDLGMTQGLLVDLLEWPASRVGKLVTGTLNVDAMTFRDAVALSRTLKLDLADMAEAAGWGQG